MIFSSFAKKLITEWRRLKLPERGASVVAAVSGGADSVSLLAALHELQNLKKLNLKIVAAHFNHNLRGAESNSDADLVRELANKFGLDFVGGSWKQTFNNKKFSGNLEQAARRARYKFLGETAETHQALAVLTAHTLNDQAETFLLRLIRGSAADGLGAMKPVTNYELRIANDNSKIYLVRPFLSWARREMTENYCRRIGLTFCHDRMNDDENFARVRVRKQVVPLLKTFNPKIVEILSNTAKLLGDEADELNAQAKSFLAENNFRLPVNPCSFLANAVLRRRVLRLWLAHERGDLRQITAGHLRAIETLMTNKQGGRTIELPGKGTVTRENGRLIYTGKVEKTEADI